MATTDRGEPDTAHRPIPDPPRRGDGSIDLDALTSILSPCDVLETAAGDGWSYVVPHDGPRVIDDGRRSWLLDERGDALDLGPDPFAAIDRVADRLAIGPDADVDPALPPFPGGLVGCLSYDLARRVERLPSHARTDRDQLHVALRVASTVVAIAPDQDRATVVAWAAAPTAQAPSRRVGDVLDRIRAGAGRRELATTSTSPQVVDTSLTRDAYHDAVDAAQAAIAAGDAFQVNVTQRLTARFEGDVHGLYRALRSASPASFGAALPDTGVASISPETFLQVQGDRVLTRPIKGTRPRSDDARVDAALADDLVTAAKDRAENVMIVDLQRNDLGRVCRTGTVRVEELAALEAHPTVWHLTSTVAGRLPPGTGYGELLRAALPCGSITGAPKVAAMELIERLEAVRRGWYCGAIGFLGPGTAHLSVAIRTATRQPDGRVDYGAGGGIVADSDPAEEYAESLDKAAAFLRAVRGTRIAADGRDRPQATDRPTRLHASPTSRSRR